MKYLWLVMSALVLMSIWNGMAIERKLKSLDARLENIEAAQ